MRFTVLLTGMLLIAGLAFGADVDGKWTGSIAGMDGNNITITYTFKADGNVLTGSSSGPDGTQIPIKDGKIDGNKISFTLILDFGGQEMKLDYTGVVSPDQIKLNFDMGGQAGEIVLKKVS